VAAAVCAAGLMASLGLARRGAWGLFWAAYILAWAIIAAAWLYILDGGHGVHGSPGNMLAWRLAIFLPLFAFAAILTGFLAFLAGARERPAANDEASR
jgi:hypothetical protein